MSRLVTEWSTDDPALGETLRLIESTPEYSSAREELEAVLHTFQARMCWQRAAQYRRREQEQAARESRRAARKAETSDD